MIQTGQFIITLNINFMIQRLSFIRFLTNVSPFYKKIAQVNLAFILGLTLMSNSCKVNEMPSENKGFSNGVVHFGDPAVDGCGWSISFKEGEYYPIDLASEFRKEGLKVAVTYSLSGKKSCAWTEINTINVHKIKLQK